ncbi:MAG TPA: DUF4386 domain-containing protein [Alkalispirochaeta sp.]|nr:DUF4386 domain-containing protein [Alkalispirochaeta sp.]
MESHSTQVNKAAVGTFVIVETLLLFVPLFILGAAINWPGSLSEPASVVLPQLIEQAGAVRAGYFIYLLYSILFFPMAYFLLAFLEGGRVSSHIGWLGVGFAAISTLSRTIGIARWLTAMPNLAMRWLEAPGRDIEIAYDTLNSLAGGIGEIIGVGLFAGIWALITSRVAIRERRVPAWIGWMGVVAGIALISPVVELLGIEIDGLVTVTTALVHLWWLIMGIAILARPAEADL